MSGEIMASACDILQVTKVWNAIVIGAGPAGAMTAVQLAKNHDKVLLLDKSNFPRYKVCGCCLSVAAVDALQEGGLAHILETAGAVPLNMISLFDGKHCAQIPLNGGMSISRERLDTELIKSAVDLGADFLPGYGATVLSLASDGVMVQLLSGNDSPIDIFSKVVIVADGLSGHSLDRLPQFDVTVKSSSRFGAGTILASAPASYEAGRIYMCCNANAYVGLVLLEDGRLDVAAAFDRNYSREQNGPARAAEDIVRAAGLELPEGLAQAHWTGTNSLTRSRKKLADTRLFVIGDSSGYAEPFTGEGMAWALWSAIAASRLASEAVLEWNDSLISQWQHIHDQLFRHRHFRSGVIANTLRNTTFRRSAVAILSSFPELANPFLSHINGHSLQKAYLREIVKAS